MYRFFAWSYVFTFFRKMPKRYGCWLIKGAYNKKKKKTKKLLGKLESKFIILKVQDRSLVVHRSLSSARVTLSPPHPTPHTLCASCQEELQMCFPLNKQKTCQTVFWVSSIVVYIPIGNDRSPVASHLHLPFGVITNLDLCHSKRCVKIAHCFSLQLHNEVEG